MTYKERTQRIRQHTAKIQEALPEVMKSFYALNKSASARGALDTKTKELIALALAVGSRCDDCIAFHTQAVLQEGASKEEIMETLAIAVFMGGGPSLMYAAHVIEAMEECQSSQ
ncbi:MAG: carboxymuconolactone decarboxylase family protein [Pseudanabaenaceae cyanobacterium SKYGB_i_bin29]|nr:carboxymuconolactone decarboxylase family protein [Pseudanabaenaceae cyanobacterium SKYG29]MDW8420719.1 carboxymuconolactone decarboxylase family protein [Pseudanabaenaceae cyanobacterium SKYGB_i_bin29]